MYLVGDAPLPAEYGFMELDELLRELPADAGERVLRRGRLRERDAASAPDPALLEQRAARRRHRPPSRQHALRRRQPRRRATPRRPARSLRDLFARARRRADARDRRGALRRARHRHRPLPVHEHDAEGAAARGRARRGRRRRPRASSSSVYESVEFAKLKLLARALERAQVLRGRPARRLVPAARATSPRSARPSRTPRGSSTTCARSRAPSWWR